MARVLPNLEPESLSPGSKQHENIHFNIQREEQLHTLECCVNRLEDGYCVDCYHLKTYHVSCPTCLDNQNIVEFLRLAVNAVSKSTQFHVMKHIFDTMVRKCEGYKYCVNCEGQDCDFCISNFMAVDGVRMQAEECENHVMKAWKNGPL